MAGYSGTPLIKKLGIKEEAKVLLINAPKEYMDFLNCDISNQLIKEISKADLIHLFVKSKKELEEEFSKLIKNSNEKLVIWVSWYKKSAGITTDVTEDVIREVVLPTGWVDIKVCAVNDIWSGLKIVKRKNQ
jgi:hypothetical protein